MKKRCKSCSNIVLSAEGNDMDVECPSCAPKVNTTETMNQKVEPTPVEEPKEDEAKEDNREV